MNERTWWHLFLPYFQLLKRRNQIVRIISIFYLVAILLNFHIKTLIIRLVNLNDMFITYIPTIDWICILIPFVWQDTDMRHQCWYRSLLWGDNEERNIEINITHGLVSSKYYIRKDLNKNKCMSSLFVFFLEKEISILKGKSNIKTFSSC